MKFFAFIGRISPFVFAVFVPVFIALVWFNLGFLKPVDKDSKELVSVEIPRNATIDDVADVLSSQNLIRSSFAGTLLLKRAKKKQGLDALVFTEGEYEISQSLTPAEVISKVLQGDTIKRSFKISEGDTFYDIAQSIEDSGLFTKDEMLRAMTNRSKLVTLKLNAGIPEGYFLPGEFVFSKPITPEQVFETMIKRSREDFEKSFTNISKRLEELSIDLYQLLTLASIIEKEAKSVEMKKLVSSVYHNRLLLQVPLESDHILAYYLKKEVSAVTTADREAPGPYNTFLKSGLPATPICTPGKESISAVIFPTRSEYLYFVPPPENVKLFSYTLDEHLEKLKSRK
jgi:UPF0755 protein